MRNNVSNGNVYSGGIRDDYITVDNLVHNQLYVCISLQQRMGFKAYWVKNLSLFFRPSTGEYFHHKDLTGLRTHSVMPIKTFQSKV